MLNPNPRRSRGEKARTGHGKKVVALHSYIARPSSKDLRFLTDSFLHMANSLFLTHAVQPPCASLPQASKFGGAGPLTCCVETRD